MPEECKPAADGPSAIEVSMVDAASAAGSSALQCDPQPKAVADESYLHGQKPQMPSQCKLAAGGLGATEISKPNQEQGRQVEADPLSPASVAEDQSSTNKGVHGGGDACIMPAAAVAGQPPTVASSNLEAVLSLLLPGLAAAAGPQGAVDTGSAHEELAAPPAFAMLAFACASAESWLDTPPAAQNAKALREGSPASAAPEEQRERLRVFVREQMWPADTTGASHAPWPEVPACEPRVADSGLCEGGLAERLFRRMGSTPAAAALLRSLVCPITKVRTVCSGGARMVLSWWVPELTTLAWLQDFARNAVVAADGCTYEREAIEGWMQHNSRSGRRIQQRLRSTQLFQNRLYLTTVGMLMAAR